MEKILGIHINAPPRVERAIDKVRHHVERYFGSQEYAPHITLYLARYRASAFHLLVQQLTTNPAPSCKVIIGGLLVERLVDGRWFLALKVRRTPLLLRQHTQLIRRANELRGGLIRTKDQARIQNDEYSAVEKKRIMKYGYSRVMSEFHPHFTIGTIDAKFSRAEAVKKVKKYLEPLQGLTWVPSEVVVGLYDFDTRRGRYTGRPREATVHLEAVKEK